MRSKGSPAELEQRRLLAVRRVLDGNPAEEVAGFLEVEARRVRRWRAVFQEHGWEGLLAKPVPGRPRKRTPTQEKLVVRWLQDPPTRFGFPTELWSCRRLAQLMGEEWGFRLHPRYLPRWLRQRDVTPQKPQRVPRERAPAAIAHGLATAWPRIKKNRFARWRTSF
ncbi:MAG: helix-turn-helix domain-containing protein [Acidobacteria bacterium]|nr:helix-turn-helix domain-containing protein [Acidobacteriota bacterium]